MKVKLFGFLTIFFILSSCLFNGSTENNFDDMVQGMWQPNTERRIITFAGQSFKIDRLFGVTEHEGTFFANPVLDEPNRWIWEDAQQVEMSLHWFSEDKEGDMVFIEYVEGFERKTMLVRGLPFSKNLVDTLHYVEDLKK